MILGNGEFYFCPDAKTLADTVTRGWDKYCSIDELGIETEMEVKKKMTACRGVKRTVKSVNRMMGLKYKLKLNELGPKQLQLLYFANPLADGGIGQSSNFRMASSGANIPLGNLIGAVAGRWYQMRSQLGVDLTDLETVGGITSTLAIWGASNNSLTLVPEVDYKIDMKLGLIMFRKDVGLTAQVFTLTAAGFPAINDTNAPDQYMRKMTPFTKASHRGMGRLYVYDDDEKNPLALKHMNFACQLTTASGPTFGDDFATMDVEIEVLDIVASEIFCRPDRDVFDRISW